MSNNNQTNDIYNISGVEDLSCDTAASIQGGAALELYRNVPGDPRFTSGSQRRIANTDTDIGLLKYSDQASFARVNSGLWRLYENDNFTGNSIDFGKGSYSLTDYGFNDKTTSVKDLLKKPF